MSATAGTWTPAAAVEQQFTSAEATSPVRTATSSHLISLVHQVFLLPSHKRERVLFVAVEDSLSIQEFCEQTAAALVEVSGATCGIVVANGSEGNVSTPKKPVQSTDPRLWRTCSTVVSRGVWRMPAWLFAAGVHPSTQANRRTDIQTSFDYLLFAAGIHAADLPLLCSNAQGAVLVVKANCTRKQSALHAKEQLSRYGVPLLGVVLTDREFVVPESLNRRL